MSPPRPIILAGFGVDANEVVAGVTTKNSKTVIRTENSCFVASKKRVGELAAEDPAFAKLASEHRRRQREASAIEGLHHSATRIQQNQFVKGSMATGGEDVVYQFDFRGPFISRHLLTRWCQTCDPTRPYGCDTA